MATKNKQKKRMKTVFVLDTNVLLNDPTAFLQMEEHDVVIPMDVIEEIDKKKNSSSIGFMARKVFVNLEPYLSPALYTTGVPLGDGMGKLSIFIVRELHPKLKKITKEDSPDNHIISAALFLQDRFLRSKNKKNEQKKKQNKKENPVSVVLISDDIDLRLKAIGLGITAESYKHGSVENADSPYLGVTTIRLDDEVVSKLYQPNGLQYLLVEESLGTDVPKPHPFEFFVIKGDGEKNHLSYYDYDKGILYPVTDDYKKIYESVTARNDEQQLAMWALLNPKIKLVTLSGIAGTGKTMLAIAAAIRQKSEYAKIKLSKPIIGLSENDLGFLPGDAQDKMLVHVQSLYDQINFLNQVEHKTVGKSAIDTLLETNMIEVEAFPYIRGRSFTNTLLIVDEAQNLSRADALAFVTRMHESSKIVLVGDPKQIDAKYLNPSNNGLSVIIEAFKDYDAAAHITLVKGERSRLAEWAATHM